MLIKKQGILIIVGTLAVAFLAANLASRFMVKKPAPKRRVVVAATQIKAGETLTSLNLKRITWTSPVIPKGLFTNISTVEGRIAAKGFNLGEPIHQNRLKPDFVKAPEPVEDGIAPGMCVVRISITPDAALNGLLEPGDKVDVIASGSLGSKNGRRISRIILSGVRVHDTDGSKPDGKEESLWAKGSRKTNQGVALVLTRNEACILSAAQNAALTLVRRDSRDDNNAVGEPVIYSAQLGAKTRQELSQMADEVNERLQSKIAVGKRAITIRVNDEDGICGFLRPGQRVDLMATHDFKGTALQGRNVPGADAMVTGEFTVSKILMQNLEILFVEEDTQLSSEIRAPLATREDMPDPAKETKEQAPENRWEEGSWASAWSTKRVTLVVSPEQAEKLAVISHTSDHVKLIVRKLGDDHIVETGGEKSSRVFYKESSPYHDITVFTPGMKKETKRYNKEAF